MKNFNNKSNENLITDLIHDIYYSNQSYRGKISRARSYGEVLIRKILDLPANSDVTLGKKDILNKLEQQNKNIPIFTNSLEIIRSKGNDYTHTKNINEVLKEEYDYVVNALFDLYACLFIYYFQKYTFRTKENIANGFSILPPIIRYKTLNFLYENDSNNIILIDKLVLAILKAFDKEKALSWIEKNKKKLKNLSGITENCKKEIISKFGNEMAEFIIQSIDKDMYRICYDKIEVVGNRIETKGLLYKEFEEAKNYFSELEYLKNGSHDEKEFFSLMEFVFLGRQEKEFDPNKKYDYMIGIMKK